MVENKTLMKILIGLFLFDAIISIIGLKFYGTQEMNKFAVLLMSQFGIYALVIFVPLSIFLILYLIPTIIRIFTKQSKIAIKYYFIYYICMISLVQINNIYQIFWRG